MKTPLRVFIGRATAFFVAVTLYSSQLFAQIPAGYYDPAAGLTGPELKAALNSIISGHTTYPYSSTSTDVWDILKEADRDPNNPNNVIGIYSGFSMDAAAEYAGGAGWNREHVWAKSRGNFGTTEGAGTDLHHLRAEDVSTNSARNNRNFGYGSDYYVDGSGNYSGATLSKTSSTEWIWEPRDEVKGDVARMIFYMATRYEGFNGEPDLELTDTDLSNTDTSPFHARLTTLLEWHQMDPVSAEEQHRNDVVYSYQHNRNPYIDHPEYVCMIYSCGTGNSAPSFTSTAVTSATVGTAYTYNVTASDANAGDVLTITATTIPAWLSLTDNGNGTAVLSGTPSVAASDNVVLSVSDGTVSVNQSFVITVSSTANAAPQFTSTPVTAATEAVSYTYNITATDADAADVLSITGTTVPAWLTLTDNGNGTATLSGTPSSTDVGNNAVVLTVSDGTASVNQSFTIVVEAQATGGGNATDLFISEYIEGSSYNKGIEIANFTGAAVNLANYSLQKQTNGAGAWGGELVLSGTLANGDVYVVVHASADPAMQAQADLITSATFVTFNGNDAVGLFKSGALLDVVGVFNSSANFGADVTLVRKATVTSPSTTYNTAEWDSYPVNTFTYLGSHQMNGGGTVTDTTAPSVPTGLAASSVTQTSLTLSWSASTDDVGVTGYDVYQGATLVTSVTGTTANITGLTASTAYSFTVTAKDLAGNVSAASAPLSVTTLADVVVVTYCSASASTSTYEWIDLVSLGTINNTTSSNGGYGDFTSLSTDLATGSTNTITFSAGFSGKTYAENWSVWIDFNHNGDFNDAGEQVATGNTTTKGNFSTSFTVPAGATLGATRMRVVMAWNETPVNCGTMSYGEVEDYTVNITSGGAARSTSHVDGSTLNDGFVLNAVAVYPNPATHVFTIEMENVVSVKAVDAQGKTTVLSLEADGRTVNVSALKTGIYTLKIDTERGVVSTRLVKK